MQWWFSSRFEWSGDYKFIKTFGLMGSWISSSFVLQSSAKLEDLLSMDCHLVGHIIRMVLGYWTIGSQVQNESRAEKCEYHKLAPFMAPILWLIYATCWLRLVTYVPCCSICKRNANRCKIKESLYGSIVVSSFPCFPRSKVVYDNA